MIVLNEKRLRSLAECGKFPIYLYWDNERNSLDFDVVKRSDAVGNIWKNPFVQPVISMDLSEQEICRKVNAVLEQELQVSQERLAPQAILTLDLGADSLAVFSVIMALEKTFGITISDIEAAKLYTVEDFQRICVRLLAETKSAK